MIDLITDAMRATLLEKLQVPITDELLGRLCANARAEADERFARAEAAFAALEADYRERYAIWSEARRAHANLLAAFQADIQVWAVSDSKMRGPMPMPPPGNAPEEPLVPFAPARESDAVALARKLEHFK